MSTTRSESDVSLQNQTTQTTTERSCEECSGTIQCIRNDVGHSEWVCDECGLVVETDAISRKKEWRAHTRQEHLERSRVGLATDGAYLGKGLGVGFPNSLDEYGANQRERRRLRRLRWRSNQMEHRGRNQSLQHALTELRALASALDLSRTARSSAGRLLQAAAEEDVFVGRNIYEVAAGCVFIGAYRTGEPRTFTEVAAATDVPPETVRTESKNLIATMSIFPLEPDVMEVIPRFVMHLAEAYPDAMTDPTIAGDPSVLLTRRSRELAALADRDASLLNRSWKTLAGSAIYAAARIEGIEVTQQQVAEAVNVSPDAIRGSYKRFIDVSDYVLD